LKIVHFKNARLLIKILVLGQDEELFNKFYRVARKDYVTWIYDVTWIWMDTYDDIICHFTRACRMADAFVCHHWNVSRYFLFIIELHLWLCMIYYLIFKQFNFTLPQVKYWTWHDIIRTGTCLQQFAKWRRSALLKLSQLIWQQHNVLSKQTRRSLNFLSWKLLDGVTCVPVRNRIHGHLLTTWKLRGQE